MHWAPPGDTWYNSLQVKATKRLSHGFDFGSSFTWAKQEDIGVEEGISQGGPVFAATNDVFNRQQNKYLSGFDQPFRIRIEVWLRKMPDFAGNGELLQRMRNRQRLSRNPFWYSGHSNRTPARIKGGSLRMSTASIVSR